MLKTKIVLIIITFLVPAQFVHASIFGEENVPLMKLVVGQIFELEKLAAALDVAKEQRDLFEKVNAGVNRTLSQIEAIEEILNRAQGLDPRNIRRISDLTNAVLEIKELKRRAEHTKEILNARISITNNAIAQSALQSETAYTMGQEMIQTGSELSRESVGASPGRASQITASAQSAQTLSGGVALQTLAHIAQLQALSLELQKTQLEARVLESESQSEYFRAQLLKSGTRQ